MIVRPQNLQEVEACQRFMFQYAGIIPDVGTAYFCWIRNNRLAACVALNGFVGKICQGHVAALPTQHFIPAGLLTAAFDYAFHERGCAMMLSHMNSQNIRAIKYNTHLGFKPLLTLPKMHENGGDLVVTSLVPEDCRYMSRKGEREQVETPAVNLLRLH